MMELAGALSNPETGVLLVGVAEALDGLGSVVARHFVVVPEPRPFQGQTVKAIQAVLMDVPDGLRTIEVWAAVERLLDRPVPKSTVKGMLAGNRAFDRVRRGVYRLRHG
jgi:hypothetical protein